MCEICSKLTRACTHPPLQLRGCGGLNISEKSLLGEGGGSFYFGGGGGGGGLYCLGWAGSRNLGVKIKTA